MDSPTEEAVLLIGSDGPIVDAVADGRPRPEAFEQAFERTPLATALVCADDRTSMPTPPCRDSSGTSAGGWPA